MIIGIGIDLCDIRRVERSLERFGSRFTHRLFTNNERTKAEQRAHPASSYAQGFAAKEACAKALGTGMRQGVFWRDMVVANHPSGQPYMLLSGGAKLRLEAITPLDMNVHINVSQSDEYPFANAIVIISAMPAKPQ